MNRGNTLLNSRNFHGDIDAYNTAISLLSTATAPYYYRAKTHTILDNHQKALKDVNLYLQSAPKDKTAERLETLIKWKISPPSVP